MGIKDIYEKTLIDVQISVSLCSHLVRQTFVSNVLMTQLSSSEAGFLGDNKLVMRLKLSFQAQQNSIRLIHSWLSDFHRNEPPASGPRLWDVKL